MITPRPQSNITLTGDQIVKENPEQRLGGSPIFDAVGWPTVINLAVQHAVGTNHGRAALWIEANQSKIQRQEAGAFVVAIRRAVISRCRRWTSRCQTFRYSRDNPAPRSAHYAVVSWRRASR